MDILVLGAGIGGLVAANELRHRLGREHRITLADKEREYRFTPSYLWVMPGWRQPAQITRSLPPLSKKGIEFIQGEVKAIHLEKRRVVVGDREIAYDYLILSLGAELAPESVPGLPQASYNLYSLDELVGLRDALPSFTGGKIAVLVSASPFKCPAAPYEAALLLDHHFRQRGLRSRVDLQIYTPEPLPMPTAGPAMGQAVKAMLEQRDIGFNNKLKIASVDGVKKELTFPEGKTAGYDLLIAVPPHRSPRVVRESGLVGESGWIPVDGHSLKTSAERVYALGDGVSIKLPSGAMLPKAGVFAHAQAQVVANNLATELQTIGPWKEFDGKGSCFIEVGAGKAGYATGDFYATPAPALKMRRPGRIHHWKKALFERYWLWRWF